MSLIEALEGRGQPDLHCEYQGILVYTVRACLKQTNKQTIL